MDELKLLRNTDAVTSDRQGSPESYAYQTRELLAFFRQLDAVLRQAFAESAAPTSVAATGSPMTYTAPGRGFLHLSGGTVTALSFVRSGVSLPLAVASAGQLVPVNPGDQVVITYSSAPTITEVQR